MKSEVRKDESVSVDDKPVIEAQPLTRLVSSDGDKALSLAQTVCDTIARLYQNLSVSVQDVLHAMQQEVTAAVSKLSDGFSLTIPAQVDMNATIGDAVATAMPTASVPTTTGTLSVALNITNFNNYSNEDIQQLTNEIMVTAGQFAKRKGVVFA